MTIHRTLPPPLPVRAALLVALALLGGACGDDAPATEHLADTGHIGFDVGRDAVSGDDAGSDDPAVEDVAIETLRLRVLTFNAGRFFDTVCDSGNCSSTSFEAVARPSEFEARADQIARALRNSGADIVLLQEIENRDCLDALHERLADGFEVAVMGEIGGSASLDVAILARGELGEVVRWRDETDLFRADGSRTEFSREFLEARLEIDGHDVIVFNAHFKSKNDDDPQRRLAEAEAAHEIVTSTAEADEDALIVFGGDLNDTPETAPLDALESDGRLIRVAAELGESDATYVFDGEPRAIDHLFLAREGRGDYISGSAQVIGSPFTGYAGSDHAALVADFLLEPDQP